MNARLAKWTRKLHRHASIVFAVPMLVVIATGLLLQLKKQVGWIQPPTAQAAGGDPTLSFEGILAAARSVPEAQIASWDDIDRLDVRPGKGLVKVQPKQAPCEIQIDTRTGEVLQVAVRRSDLIESLHDGSFFSEPAKLFVFLPNGLILLFLWCSGLILWYLPWSVKRAARRRSVAGATAPTDSGRAPRDRSDPRS